MKRKPLQNVFSDTSSLVLRSLLSDSAKKWTLVELAKRGVSLGLVSEVLRRAEKLGYVERVLKGPNSYTRLIRKDELLKDWLRSYSFDQNQQAYYLYVGKGFLKEAHRYLEGKGVRHAFTLYSASRLISPYVKDDRHFIYLDIDRNQFEPFLKEFQLQWNLYELVQGGNVCFILPFYRSAVFNELQKVKGCPLVSNLQLYLDLMGFPPIGSEEAQHLITVFQKKGKSFV
ncbi:MAG: hypothetical protein HYS08_08615 [Chlamydiae bacterium]|nr:hypothetical protein [Chlamydiota bacterium]